MVEVTIRTDCGKGRDAQREEFKTGTRDLAVVTGISFRKTAEGETDCESVTQVIGVAEDKIWASIALAESTASALMRIADTKKDMVHMMGAFIDTFFTYSTEEAGSGVMAAATKMVLEVNEEWEGRKSDGRGND